MTSIEACLRQQLFFSLFANVVIVQGTESNGIMKVILSPSLPPFCQLSPFRTLPPLRTTFVGMLRRKRTLEADIVLSVGASAVVVVVVIVIVVVVAWLNAHRSEMSA
jgi:hypothetical protein